MRKQLFCLLTLTVVVIVGLFSRSSACQAAPAMDCCMQQAEQVAINASQCVMDEDCCQCGQAPASYAPIPAALKTPQPMEYPCNDTLRCSRVVYYAGNQRLAGAYLPEPYKPTQLYLLHRSLLI